MPDGMIQQWEGLLVGILFYILKYINADPMSLNPYLYCGNNPLNNIYRMGLKWRGWWNFICKLFCKTPCYTFSLVCIPACVEFIECPPVYAGCVAVCAILMQSM